MRKIPSRLKRTHLFITLDRRRKLTNIYPEKIQLNPSNQIEIKLKILLTSYLIPISPFSNADHFNPPPEIMNPKNILAHL